MHDGLSPPLLRVRCYAMYHKSRELDRYFNRGPIGVARFGSYSLILHPSPHHLSYPNPTILRERLRSIY